MIDFMYAKKIKEDIVMEVIDKYKDDYYLNISYKPNGDTEIFIGDKKKEVRASLVLGKVKAEIKEWYHQADKQALAKDPCVVDAMVDLFIRTIDKYKAESEVQG